MTPSGSGMPQAVLSQPEAAYIGWLSWQSLACMSLSYHPRKANIQMIHVTVYSKVKAISLYADRYSAI